MLLQYLELNGPEDEKVIVLDQNVSFSLNLSRQKKKELTLRFVCKVSGFVSGKDNFRVIYKC